MENSEELNQLAQEFNAVSRDAAADSAATARVDHWLKMLVDLGGSDLLLVESAAPCARVQGEIRKLEPTPLDGPEIEAAVLPALSQHALRLYREAMIADSSYRIEGLGRFRINLHRERGRAAAAIRALPTNVPALEQLHLPPTVSNLAICRADWC
jgi:Tfp pilus assembly pilus retraction ATPase PilT